MKESILIEFDRGGEPAPVTSVRANGCEPQEAGIILSGETSASARGFALDLQPQDAATRFAFERVQQRLCWLDKGRFEVKVGRDDDRLRLEGVDGEALPQGSYELRLRVSGMDLRPASQIVRIPQDGAATARFRERESGRRLRLSRPVAEFDAESRRILEHPRSMLDGRSAADWLMNGKHQDRRKAVLLNVLAKLAATPSVREPLNRHVEHVFFAELDRIYCGVTAEFHKLVRRTFGHDAVVHPTHRRLVSRIAGDRQGDYRLESYREKASNSLQAVVASPAEGGSGRGYYADVDIDRGNPGWDVRSFLVHVGEVLDPRQTDHLKMHEKLASGRTSDFLYYDVVRG